jgi:transcriptional regulator with XRE-family HTH domain
VGCCAYNDLARIGASIRAHREQLGLSQQELAARADMHRTYIGGVERGERNLSTLNLMATARALEVEVGDLCNVGDRA